MNRNTLKAIKRRVDAGMNEFTIGERTYYVNRERKTVIYYSQYVGGPQIIYFEELE